MSIQIASFKRCQAITWVWMALTVTSSAMAQTIDSSAPGVAVTQTPAPSHASLTPPATSRVGDATNHLLKLQEQGQYASRNAYPVTSDVAQRTYKRYLESFSHSIPENSATQVGVKAGASR